MASTASPSLKLELIGTGDQSGTWGVTTNTNLGTLLEQAITGYISIVKSGITDYTLSNTDYVSNENRNAVIEFTGTPGGAFNVIVPNAEKLWVFKNSTNGAMTIKTSGGATTVTVATSTSRWVFCDGAGAVYDALTGTLATQSASSVAITGGTITGLTNLTLASGAATPATNDAATLGTSSLMWGDLFLASGGVVNFNNGDVTITHSTNGLAFAGADNGYTFSNTVKPSANDGAALGVSGTAFSDLFLASGGVVNFDAGDVTITHSANALAFAGATSYTFNGGTAYYAGGTDVALADGGTGASLTDPNADRIMFWDDSAGQVTWLTAGSGLTITDTTLAVSVSSPISNAVGNNTATNTQTFNTSGTWTKPNTGNVAIVYAWGGGAAGAEEPSALAGGSGGGFTAKILDLSSMGATETVTVGAAGTINTAPGSSNIGALVTAYGAGRSNVGGNLSAASGGGGGSNSAGTSGATNTQNGIALSAGIGGGGVSTISYTVPMSVAGMGQTNVRGFMPIYPSIEGKGAPGVRFINTTGLLNANGTDAEIGGGSGGATLGTLANGGNSIFGGGGGSAGLGAAVANSGTSVYGGRGGYGSTNTTAIGAQPGGGGAGPDNNIVGSGGAGKVIVYVY